MEVNQETRANKRNNICRSVQAIQLYRVDSHEIEFRLVCDAQDRRRVLKREKCSNLPADARVADRFEVEMVEQRDATLDPFCRHHCIELIITARKRVPTLADIQAPVTDARRRVMRDLFGSSYEEKVHRDQVAWYEELQRRRTDGND